MGYFGRIGLSGSFSSGGQRSYYLNMKGDVLQRRNIIILDAIKQLEQSGKMRLSKDDLFLLNLETHIGYFDDEEEALAHPLAEYYDVRYLVA